MLNLLSYPFELLSVQENQAYQKRGKREHIEISHMGVNYPVIFFCQQEKLCYHKENLFFSYGYIGQMTSQENSAHRLISFLMNVLM